MYGIEVDGCLGYSLSGAGDVDGDTVADLVLSASLASPGGVSGAGQVFIVYGGRSCP